MTCQHDFLWKRTLLASSAFVALAVARPAFAQTHQFNIEAQPAQSGIPAFARQAGIQILVSQEVVQGLSTRPVKGQFDTPTALHMLLENTGLDAKPTGEGVYAVVRHEVAQTAVASVDTVIVTGRVGVDRRTRADTSYSVSAIPQEQLREEAVSSVADAIRKVPGFWVENSGGEASANIRARGLPIDGYGSVQLEEDGLPVQHDPALGYLNADQSFRLDETIDQVQVVRGGPSSIFNSNAPGGVINFITRQPGPTPEGLVKLTAGDDGLARADFWYGARVDGWKLAVGGFYRYEDGTRDPGFPLNNGGQFRIDVGHDLGNGSIDIDYKHIDDKVGFYVGVPVSITRSTVSSIPGFNANSGSILGGENAKFPIYTPNGPSQYNLADGTKVLLDQLSIHATQNVDGWHIDDRFRIRGTDQDRNYLTPSAEVYTTSQCLTSQISNCLNGLSNVAANASALFPTMASLQLRYADNGSLVSPTANGNGLVMPSTANDEVISEHEVLDDFRLSRNFDIAGQEHDVTIGAYFAIAGETFHKYQATILTDVENHARLVNAVAVNSAGQQVGSITDDGVIRDGAGFGDGNGHQYTEALYLADEWHITPALRLDAGVREEHMSGNGAYENVTSANLTSATGTLATSAIAEGNGIWTPYKLDFSAATWTVGLNYQLDPRQGVFVRATGAARLPGIANYITNTSPPTPGSVETAHSQMYELGYKYSRPFLDAYITLFDTDTQDYGLASQPVLNPASNVLVTEEVNGKTRDYGVEMDGDVRPIDWFDVAFTATVQDPQFTDFSYVLSAGAAPTSYSGNQLLRIPHTSFAVSPSVHFLQDRFKAGLDIEYYGSRYADVANTQYLPAYTVVSANTHYDVTPQLTVYVSAYNLTNTIGLTEGNARAGEVVSSLGSGTNFVARPIIGRTFKASILYKF
ncbi:MAG: TonB-dependent receptor [Caulobacteraceae bacterium]